MNKMDSLILYDIIMEDCIKILIVIAVLTCLFIIFNLKIIVGGGFEGFDGHMNDDYNIIQEEQV